MSEIGGKEASADPNREIGFGFVSCWGRACVRSCVSVCGGMLLNAGGSNGQKYCSGVGFAFSFFIAIRIGFKQFLQYVLPYTLVLRIII